MPNNLHVTRTAMSNKEMFYAGYPFQRGKRLYRFCSNVILCANFSNDLDTVFAAFVANTEQALYAYKANPYNRKRRKPTMQVFTFRFNSLKF